MPLTQKDIQQIVTALDPKFKEINKKFEGMDERFRGFDEKFQGIDERFLSIDKQFENMSLEIGNMMNNLSGDAAFFQSEVRKRFGHIDQKLEAHDKLFEQIFDYMKPISTASHNQEKRITNLENLAK